MTGTFKDHFSGHANDYSQYRPTYPPELFATLAALAPDDECAWDCATGNGQAAVSLVTHFAGVEATDASAEQISHAEPHPRICYSVAPAEASGLPTGSVSLVTVAQALHWFDFERFYAEVRRVAKADALCTAWCYGLCAIAPAVDEVVRRFYVGKVGPFWPPERRFIDERYRTLPFPFPQVQLPAFAMTAEWTLTDFMGYLGTWSAVQRYRRQHGNDPLAEIAGELSEAWDEPDRSRTVRWPLDLLAGFVV